MKGNFGIDLQSSIKECPELVPDKSIEEEVLGKNSSIGLPNEAMEALAQHDEDLLSSHKKAVLHPKNILADPLKFHVEKKYIYEGRVYFKLKLDQQDAEEHKLDPSQEYTVSNNHIWEYDEIAQGDYVRVLGHFHPDTRECRLDDYADDVYTGYLVLEPDTYLTATQIAASTECMRRGFIELVFPRNTPGVPYPLLLGTMVHESMDLALVHKDELQNIDNEIVEEILTEHLTELHLTTKTEEEARVDLKEYMALLKKMIETYIVNKKPIENTQYVIQDILAIEQKMFCRRFGIKGITDVTIEVHSQKSEEDPLIAAIELKSGEDRNQTSHLLQACLYALMLYELHPKVNQEQFLLYPKHSRFRAVKIRKNDYVDILQKRNRLVKFQHEVYRGHFIVPKQALKERDCLYCSHASFCYCYAKAYSMPTPEELHQIVSLECNEGIAEAFSPSVAAYFRKWNTLITQEQNFCEKRATVEGVPVKRSLEQEIVEEKKLVLLDIKKEGKDTKIYFRKKGDVDTEFYVGNHVDIFCSENPLMILGRGRIASREVNDDGKFRSSMLSLYISDTVMVDIHLKRKGIIEMKKFTWTLRSTSSNQAVFNVMRWSLLTLCSSPLQQRLREIIIDLKRPNTPGIDWTREKLEKEHPELISMLNSEQLHALLKSLNCTDYQLVLGVPGSGKTATIAALLEILARSKKRVFVGTISHSTLDAILRRLLPRGVKFIRVSPNKDAVHPDIQPFLTTSIQSHYDSYREYLKAIEDIYIYGSTSYGIINDILRAINFDYCIIDEASMMLEPACICPLLFSKKFILFGDSIQTSPMCTNRHAKTAGYGQSLFERLAKTENSALTKLCRQHIMNQQIMRMLNEIIYGGIMECGNEFVRDQKLFFPNIKSTGFEWVDSACNPVRSVLFVNTDTAMENFPAGSSEKPSKKNKFECWAVLHLVNELLQMGLDPGSIGVVSPYIHQLMVFKEVLESKKLEILTIEKCQVTAKDCLIISCVKQSLRPELLREALKIPQVFARARSKLIIIGSYNNLKDVATLSNFFMFIKREQMEAHILDIIAEKEYCNHHYSHKEIKSIL